MNIGFDASRAFIGNRTGTENYSYQILKNLVQMDHTNKYYIYVRPDSRIDQINQKISETVNQFASISEKTDTPVHRNTDISILSGSLNTHLKVIPYPRLWTQAGLAQQTFKDKLDVLFIPAHTIPLIRKPGLKTVVTVHDLGAEYLPKAHQIKQRLYLNLMTHHQLKSATHIIAVSEATKDDLVKKVGIPADKITVVYEGYNEELFKPAPVSKLSRTLSNYKLQPNSYFLFVGTIQPRKNLARLIEAYAKYLKSNSNVIARSEATKQSGEEIAALTSFARNDGLKLVLAGSKGWLSDEIYKLPKKLGIEDQVKFLGYVPDEKLPALYSGAKAFLFTSLFEGFGLPVLEAMAVGCPVLTSNTSSLPEVAGKAAILVNPYSTEEITQGIERIMNEELRIKNVKAGFEQIKKFSWEKAARETLVVLEKVSKR